MKVSKVLAASATLVGSSSKLLFLVRMADATTDAEHSNKKRVARLTSKQKNLGILAHKSEGGVRGDEVEFGIRELQSPIPNACCSAGMGEECAAANQACYDCVVSIDSRCSTSWSSSCCACEAAGGISACYDATGCAGVCASNNCPPSVCCLWESVCDPNPPFNEDQLTCPEDCGESPCDGTPGVDFCSGECTPCTTMDQDTGEEIQGCVYHHTVGKDGTAGCALQCISCSSTCGLANGNAKNGKPEPTPGCGNWKTCKNGDEFTAFCPN